MLRLLRELWRVAGLVDNLSTDTLKCRSMLVNFGQNFQLNTGQSFTSMWARAEGQETDGLFVVRRSWKKYVRS